MKKNKKQLINNIIGQLNGINKMIEKEKDCFEIMTQMKAAKSAFDSFMLSFTEENFIECSSGMKKNDKEKMKKLLKSLIKK